MNIKAFIYKLDGEPRLCNMNELDTLGKDEIFANTIDIDDYFEFVKLYLNGYDLEFLKDIMKLWCAEEVQITVFKEIIDYLDKEIGIASNALEACEFGDF